MPEISIITPVFNRAAMLRECVASVVAQDFTDWEMLLVDDGSTDETPRVIAELAAAEPRVRALRRERGGPGAARNLGLRQAQGRFVAFLDSDDSYLPGALSQLYAAIAHSGENTALIYANLLRRDEVSGLEKRLVTDPPIPRPGIYFQFLVPGVNPIVPSTCIARRAMLEAIGEFREDLSNSSDLEMWTRLIMDRDIEKLEATICRYRRHPTQITADEVQRRLCRDQVISEFLHRLPIDTLVPSPNQPSEQARELDRLASLMLHTEYPAVDSALFVLQQAQQLAPIEKRRRAIARLEHHIPDMLARKFGDSRRIPAQLRAGTNPGNPV